MHNRICQYQITCYCHHERRPTHPETKPLPSGLAPKLKTQLECPFISATAALPLPDEPADPARTSCRTIRRSSDPENKYCEHEETVHQIGASHQSHGMTSDDNAENMPTHLTISAPTQRPYTHRMRRMSGDDLPRLGVQDHDLPGFRRQS